MNYTIAWVPSAHDRLERIWMAASDKRLVTRAADAIDNLLAANPYRSDALLLDEENTLIVEPLAVNYRIDEGERKVIIGAVWMIGFLED